MKTLLSILICVLIATIALATSQDLLQSDLTHCAWSYSPGIPIYQQADTLNPSGILVGWDDNDYRVSQDFVQPVKVFYVVIPPGTFPQLSIRSIRSSAMDGGLAAAPERVPRAAKESLRNWAIMDRVEDWKGFRLARILVALQIGDASHSEILASVQLDMSFVGTVAAFASHSRDGDLLSDIAVNAAVADRWWREEHPASKTRSLFSWPDFPLVRLAVTETAAYSITGSSLAGQSLVGQPTDRIKLFGNGGGLLPTIPDSPVDQELMEDAIIINDYNENGIFDSQDRVLFYGKGLKGADYCDGTYLNALAHQSPFATENAYFIGVDPSGSAGLRMQNIPTAVGGTPVTRTVSRVYLDQDAFIFSPGDQAETGLIWYMSSIGPGQERSFLLNLEGAVGTAGQFHAHFQSVGYVGQLFDTYIGDSLVDPSHFSTAPYTVPIGAGVLTPGNNRVRFINRSNVTVHVNYLEIEYDRELSAPTGKVAFSAPQSMTGLFRYSIDELGADAMFLDVTDPLHPRVATGNSIADSSYSQNPRRYYALRPDSVRQPTYKGVKTHPEDDYAMLRDPSNGAGLIILTYDDWYDDLDTLKAFHQSYREEPLSVIRVRLGDVFDEFSWGVRDPVAIRNFLRYAYYNWHGSSGTDTVKYVLFVGDGDYDYRNIESQTDANWMPPWENGSECTDDFYLIFGSPPSDLPWLLSGRWPVQSRGELEAAISKTIVYAKKPLYSPWKNTATFAADDEYKGGCKIYENAHTIQAENLINSILPEYFTFKKIYEIFYPFKNTPAGPMKPDATRDLVESINRGTLIVNYAGHGNERVWTDEQMFVMDRDMKLLDNYRMWPLFLAATCSWGGYDKPIGRCFPELLLADPVDGAIASVAATRFTFVGPNNGITNAFYGELFRQGLSSRKSFGRAMWAGKATRQGSADLYHVLGDPVLRLATPEYFAQVTEADDSLRALSLYHLSGELSQTADGPIWSDFSGVVEVRVFDTEDSTAYYWCGDNSNAPYYIKLPGNAIFRGTTTVSNGQFNVTFRVPRDVRYGGNNAKISLYYFGKSESSADSADGIGIQRHIPIAEEASTETDSIPPQISLWLEVPSFRTGDLVSSTPKLHVDILDSSGVNLSGEVGHKITVRIDDAQTEDLTPFFNYDLDSYISGQLEKVIGPLSEGDHRLTVEAWDSFNNLNQAVLAFRVGQSGEAGYAVRDVYNWPNPMSDKTYFTYFLTQSDTRKVSLKIFTMSGKLVDEMDGLGTAGPAFNSNSDRPWYGRDREGHMLANGVYFYKIKAEHANGHKAEAIGKLVILH